ncbi:TRAP transporter small permease [Paenibacillus naphthalenovorans]|uniref:DctQ component of tripartite ATP-independent periplasmic transporter n=2 Tax=Paenibacillus naphthalenovorans TaxID=162209 RepID=A0A0U2MTY4_9BACL|nr:DctQ component of tripartite ATP-independent periplasmic transporter [Paenibacillus naphthalenovorans]GCL70796.1 TRAP transporter small permease [Paenibacillus naphthalenovorans]
MKKMSRTFTRIVNVSMAGALLLMAILVFGNVVLRYLFNTGITWSEEAARFLFVWLTFLGAVGALNENQHLGVDLVLKKLSPALRKLVFLISNVIMLCILGLVLDGSWTMVLLNWNTKSPAIGISMSVVFGAGMVMAIGMAAIIGIKLFKAFFQHIPVSELDQTRESEEEIMSVPNSSSSAAFLEKGVR